MFLYFGGESEANIIRFQNPHELLKVWDAAIPDDENVINITHPQANIVC